MNDEAPVEAPVKKPDTAPALDLAILVQQLVGKAVLSGGPQEAQITLEAKGGSRFKLTVRVETQADAAQ